MRERFQGSSPREGTRRTDPVISQEASHPGHLFDSIKGLRPGESSKEYLLESVQTDNDRISFGCRIGFEKIPLSYFHSDDDLGVLQETKEEIPAPPRTERIRFFELE